MKAGFQIAECSLTSAKLMQTSAMAKKSSHFIYCAIWYPSSLYLSSVLVRSRFYDFAPSSSRALSHLCPLFIYKKWGSEQAKHPSLPHSLYIKSEIKNTPLYISSEIKIILYISLPRIKIILYPRAKNRHHSIYFLGTKVSQVWSS